mmetsp:Transcript_13995/g.43739  ORF Transcript_13995/g.43739 Transcript_13995/m.43739 type:complete len:365 (-) Transcript_13995:75-1169(-)
MSDGAMPLGSSSAMLRPSTASACIHIVPNTSGDESLAGASRGLLRARLDAAPTSARGDKRKPSCAAGPSPGANSSSAAEHASSSYNSRSRASTSACVATPAVPQSSSRTTSMYRHASARSAECGGVARMIAFAREMSVRVSVAPARFFGLLGAELDAPAAPARGCSARVRLLGGAGVPSVGRSTDAGGAGAGALSEPSVVMSLVCRGGGKACKSGLCALARSPMPRCMRSCCLSSLRRAEFHLFLIALSVRPVSSLAISFQRVPCRCTSAAMIASSSADHAPFFTSGQRCWTQRSRHCLPARLSMPSEILVQFRAPCSAISSISSLSSSADHGFFTHLGRAPSPSVSCESRSESTVGGPAGARA